MSSDVRRDLARRAAHLAGELFQVGRETKRYLERSVRRELQVTNDDRCDVARQAANVAGALFQVGMTAVAGRAISEVVDEGPPSLVEPAGYAFAIWGLIFLLSLAYAAYQALPGTRPNGLLRRVGWLTALAFTCTGLWSVVVPQRQLLPALAMLVIAWACLAVVYLRAADAARQRALSAGERWLVALPFGIFLGWLTAAVAVSVVSEVVRSGLVGAGSDGEPVLGAALLLVGGGLAAAVVLAGKDGPPQGDLAYGATVLWALVGVIAAQYDASTLTAATAAAAAGAVSLAMLRNLGGRLRRGAGCSFAPEAA